MKLKPSVLTVATVLLLLQTSNIIAQTRKPNRTPAARPSQSVTTQTATTKDGRTVILKSDGTWVYADDEAPAVESTPRKSGGTRPNSVLSFETGLVFKSGDVKPLARSTFYLLDDNLENILRNAGFQPESDLSLLNSLGMAYYGRELEKYRTTYDKAMEAMKPHIVATVTTDFNGKAQFSAVPEGTYYLMGIGQLYKQVVLWNLKVDLNSGQNSVTLDQNNAAVVF
jgi:hypothetical protein